MSDLTKIAVDAMGGDGSPKKIIDGIVHSHKSNKKNFFKIFGNKIKIESCIKDKLDKNFYEIVHTDNIVKSTDSPLEAAKRGKDTSMWLAIESVKKKETDIVISAGNTGALLVIAKLNLKMIENIDKPALSALWPNKRGMSVVLDLGANIECSSKNLVDFSIMGASLYKSLYPNETPNTALLNIGSEELKGNETIKETFQILNEKKSNNFNFSGYIEGNEIMDGKVNVIVSDGFTGNVALKTAEGTANFITTELKRVFQESLLGKISAILNYSNFNKFKKRLDPRLYNGAIFIGLDSPVVKSHGGTDFIGFSNSLSVCSKIVRGDLINKIRENIWLMRINLTKKDLVNSIYMQVGFSKNIAEKLIEEFFFIIVSNLIENRSVKISNFGTFLVKSKNSRIGRNPKTKEEKKISKRNVVLFKPSKEFKQFLNKTGNNAT